MAAATPLTRHRRFATRDVDEARDEVAQVFCPHFLTPTRPGSGVDMLHHAASVGDAVTLNYLRYGDEVRITPGTFDTFFLAQIPLAGTARVKVGDRVVASDRNRATIGSPTEPVDMIWSADCEQLLVHIRREAVESVAASDTGEHRPVVFDPLLDLAMPAVRSWLRLVHLALDDLDAGGMLFRSPLAAVSFEQALIAGLLSTQPNSTGSAEAPVAVGSRTVRAATAAVEAEPDRPWRLADLAQVAGVSPRTLQDAFQRELDVTPLEHVRRVRLERARRDLLAADPAVTSVTDVASRWGFFHLGRFSQAYRGAFHELPSQTLAR
jgi:AraC-like DNA-binding protein